MPVPCQGTAAAMAQTRQEQFGPSVISYPFEHFSGTFKTRAGGADVEKTAMLTYRNATTMNNNHLFGQSTDKDLSTRTVIEEDTASESELFV